MFRHPFRVEVHYGDHVIREHWYDNVTTMRMMRIMKVYAGVSKRIEKIAKYAVAVYM